jgi:hypothetical protein
MAGGGEMDEKKRQEALSDAASRLGDNSAATLGILGELWDQAFFEGRLAALDELQDRLCVCMK